MDPYVRHRWKYDDPDPDDRGLLLSDKIHKFCEVGLIISHGYDPRHLRPASYTLTIGEQYIDSDGREQRLTNAGDSFVFKKNSIVYVSTDEEFDLPYYIVARFNLRVKWVYEGILLGTGPQIDPGFRGRLSCPLHNLTNLDIMIKRGQEFATIDFEKTTSFLNGCDHERKHALLKESEGKGHIEINHNRYLLYRQIPLQALEHHPARVLISSLAEMRDEVRKWRYIGIGLVVAFLALTVSLLGLFSNVYRQSTENLRELEQNRTKIELLEQRIPQRASQPGSGGEHGTDTGKSPGDNKQEPRKHNP